MAVSKKEGMTSEGRSKSPILESYDSEKVGDISNEIFHFMIRENMANFDVSRILIDGWSSCNIMYTEVFEKPGMKREIFSPYMRSNLQAFNCVVTCP